MDDDEPSEEQSVALVPVAPAPGYTSPFLAWSSFLSGINLNERTDTSNNGRKYTMDFLDTGEPAGVLWYISGNMYNQRSHCLQHTPRCKCWVTIRLPTDIEPEFLLSHMMEWISLRCTPEEHLKEALELKRKFGLNV